MGFFDTIKSIGCSISSTISESIDSVENYVSEGIQSVENIFSSKAEAAESSSYKPEQRLENSADRSPSLFISAGQESDPSTNFDITGDSTRNNELKNARDQIGIVNEETRFGTAGEAPWCAKFVTDVAKRAGINLDSNINWDYVPDISKYAKNRGAYSEDKNSAKPGDWIVFNNTPGSSDPKSGNDHIGIIEKIYADGTIVTIEGNTQPKIYSDGCGEKNNIPDQVARKVYSPSNFAMYSKIQGFINLQKINNKFQFSI